MRSPDDVVRDYLYQPLADLVSARWSRSCFWLAAQCGYAIPAANGLWTVLHIEREGIAANLFPLALCPGLVLCSYLYHQEAVSRHNAALRGTLWPPSAFDLAFRLLSLAAFLTEAALLVAGLVDGTTSAFVAAQVAALLESLALLSCRYFMACRLSPPRRQTAPRADRATAI
jgi:hypothetical protein